MGPCVGSGRAEKFPLPVRPLFRQTENVTQSVSVKQKRRDRPATGTDQIVGVRLEAETIKALDRLVIRENISRSGIIRRLIELGLKAAKAEK
jgi:Ribbon-helix-helix protein, copG family